MAKKNNNIQLILFVCFIFILVKLIGFITEYIAYIVTILAIILVYCMLRRRNKKRSVNNSRNKSTKQTDFNLVSNVSYEDQEVNYSSKFESDKNINDIVIKKESISPRYNSHNKSTKQTDLNLVSNVSYEDQGVNYSSKFKSDKSINDVVLKTESISPIYNNKEIRKDMKSKYSNIYSIKDEECIENMDLVLNKIETVVNNNSESIIDVTLEDFDLSIDQSDINSKAILEIPHWEHIYIYSYNEIKSASRSQKRFYFYFKLRFLNNEYVDINGYSNYAFILLFDLLNKYEAHHNLQRLEKQFKFLGEICPKTKSYSLNFIKDLLKNRTDSSSVEKLNNLEDQTFLFENEYSDYNPNAYRLGELYRVKLKLNKQDITWLNKFWKPSNVFITIEGCCIATINQYLLILRELNKKLKLQNSTIEKEVNYFKEEISNYKEIETSELETNDEYYTGKKIEEELFLCIFKRVENSVRKVYGHNRKIGSVPYYVFNGEFESRIGDFVNELLIKFQDEIIQPNIVTQIELNVHNINRWRKDFSELKDSFQNKEKEFFINGVINLEEVNKKNPNIENIFFEASKFIAKFDNVESLRYYAKYIYYDLKSKKVDNKELTKTVQKILFKTDEQISNFKIIISKLINTKDLQTALDDIDKIYIPKRKRIKLDKTEIIDIERSNDGTVELLNEYLISEQEFSIVDVESYKGINKENIIKTIDDNSIFIAELSINAMQEQLIKNIVANSFVINQDEVDKFASEKGMFKNQLIDSINEARTDYLDGELLIEEDNENYVIEESYFKEIVL
jgi:hypothetical protein